ncbi:MAG: hypothetical protein JNK64_04630 [Myxococcales bacterium]|nr:hypothetical protein [Myxococcales bacterium]
MTPAWAEAIARAHPLLAIGARQPWPARPRALVVIGGAGAGKTTAVDAVRAAAVPGVVVPLRRVTRPPRAGDHPAEAIVCAAEAMAADVAAGVVAPSWWRRLDGDRRERYGFVASAAPLAVYSANNAIVDPGCALAPPDALAAAIVVAIAAPAAVRAARLAARSPDLAAAERAARLAESTPAAHLVIDGGGDDPAAVGAALVAVVRVLARAAAAAAAP